MEDWKRMKDRNLQASLKGTHSRLRPEIICLENLKSSLRVCHLTPLERHHLILRVIRNQHPKHCWNSKQSRAKQSLLRLMMTSWRKFSPECLKSFRNIIIWLIGLLGLLLQWGGETRSSSSETSQITMFDLKWSMKFTLHQKQRSIFNKTQLIKWSCYFQK